VVEAKQHQEELPDNNLLPRLVRETIQVRVLNLQADVPIAHPSNLMMVFSLLDDAVAHTPAHLSRPLLYEFHRQHQNYH
tara:strand:+ start:255 stop:491 length:237 start_codon:yes stop_codon:yes gene_type:complete